VATAVIEAMAMGGDSRNKPISLCERKQQWTGGQLQQGSRNDGTENYIIDPKINQLWQQNSCGSDIGNGAASIGRNSSCWYS